MHSFHFENDPALHLSKPNVLLFSSQASGAAAHEIRRKNGFPLAHYSSHTHRQGKQHKEGSSTDACREGRSRGESRGLLFCFHSQEAFEGECFHDANTTLKIGLIRLKIQNTISDFHVLSRYLDL